jgi:hypothetical protein
MVDELPEVGDLKTFYQGTVAMYRGRPVLVERINPDRVFKMKDLITNEFYVAPYDPRTISSSVNRLGMVNRNGVAYYLQRIPARRWQMGINSSNTTYKTLKNVDYRSAGLNNNSLSECATSEVAQTLMNDYPSFKDALSTVKTFGGVVAFDRQFAVDDTRRIHYKNQVVGRLPRMCTSPEYVEFNPEFAFLKCAIGEISHDKIARSIG